MELGECILPLHIPAVPSLSFRTRLEDLALEHETLQRRCEALEAENADLKERLRQFGADTLQDRIQRFLDPNQIPGAPAAPGVDGGQEEFSYSSSSSSEEEAEDNKDAQRPRRRRQHRHHRRTGRGRRHKTRGRERRRHRHRHGSHAGGGGHGSSRAPALRSRSRSPARGAAPQAPAPMPALGFYGSGDHDADIEEFIAMNQLDSACGSALRALPSVDDQKAVMGTDGGSNAFMMIDKVRNPSGVVMSRIRRLGL
eukprot:TRINITY_DN66656_c0_g1_i1.p1 TRINITY_DN66656_c0_g1~~TRINITY_DN66656_c0_g1_i1.p1  ORF type:complete len:266 (+),score=30.80 TRINITY_DN66656_c0_g1_i1:35-799(+)